MTTAGQRENALFFVSLQVFAFRSSCIAQGVVIFIFGGGIFIVGAIFILIFVVVVVIRVEIIETAHTIGIATTAAILID